VCHTVNDVDELLVLVVSSTKWHGNQAIGFKYNAR